MTIEGYSGFWPQSTLASEGMQSDYEQLATSSDDTPLTRVAVHLRFVYGSEAMSSSAGFANSVFTCVLAALSCLTFPSVSISDSVAEIVKTQSPSNSSPETMIASSVHRSANQGSVVADVLPSDHTRSTSLHTSPTAEVDELGEADEQFLRSIEISADSLASQKDESLLRTIAPRPGQLTILVLVFAFFGGRELLRTRN